MWLQSGGRCSSRANTRDAKLYCFLASQNGNAGCFWQRHMDANMEPYARNNSDS